jgi:8-oxo-dGTP pyrophosphatase MutT (NUDIX family)
MNDNVEPPEDRRRGRVAPAEDFFERARARLGLDVPAGLTDPDVIPSHGDHDIDPLMKAISEVRPVKPASVLVPVVARAEPMVLLTQRTAHLPEHAGQISFPGGKIDAQDTSPLAAALREAEEEIGLDHALVEPIGYLDLYMTTLGYRIVPVLARVSPDYTLTLNPGEVDHAFEVPLAHLMEPANHQLCRRDWRGMERRVYVMPFGEREIWGITAGILRNLWERLYAS